MRIAIDIDDTLTDSFDYFQPYVAEFFGVKVEELREKNISYSNLPEEWAENELDFCRTYYDRTAADTPFKNGAADGVRTLKKYGHKILIITGRTTDFYTDPYETTRKELEKGDIVYDELICTLDKGTACKNNNVDVLIDDSIANCNAAAENGSKAVLFTSKANSKTPTCHKRVEKWSDILESFCPSDRKSK